MASNASPSGFDPVDQLVEEYLERRRQGERPTPAEYAARYPEHAAEIFDLFPAMEMLERLKPAADARASLPGGALGSSQARSRLEKLGDYTLIRELGHGGMGIVYEAERESLKNRVALKVMHGRFRADDNYVRRFQTEARSAAKLHHTNIVSVFDYGEQGGVCYYAMQYIAGEGLDRVLEQMRRLREPPRDSPSPGVVGETRAMTTASPLAASRGLLTGEYSLATTPETDVLGGLPTVPYNPPAMGSIVLGDAPPAFLPAVGGSKVDLVAGRSHAVYFREVARLGAQVADALDYAHRQGVVHRDIKPSNLLLDPRGNIWVTDFGLAKFVEDDEYSRSHELVGTLRFMAPERFQGITDRRGDIYALGATLYEMLTLRPAFTAPDQARLMELIAHEPPTPLRNHDPRIPRDLETLVLKALAKERNDRFATAGSLGEELERFLESRPIQSRPVPAHERFGRWCWRNPRLAGASMAAATVTVLLVIGAIVASLTLSSKNQEISEQLVQARDSRTEAIQARTAARVQLFEALQDRARAGRFSRRMGQRFASLAALSRATAIARELQLPSDRFDVLRDEAIAALALPDMEETGRVIPLPPGVLITAVDPTRNRYALRFADRVQVHRVADDVEVARFSARGDRDVYVFKFSPNGQYLATTHFPGFALTVWDIDRRIVSVDDTSPVAWTAARFSPDSRHIAVSHFDGEMLTYELGTGRPRRRWQEPTNATDLAFRPDGAQIAVVANESLGPACRILDSDTGRLVRSIRLPSLGSVAWSPDGATLATGSEDRKLYLWDAAVGSCNAALEGSTNRGMRVFFHPSGTLVACDGWEGRLRLWDAVRGRPVLNVAGSLSHPDSAFSRDGRISLSHDGRLTTYQVEPALEYQTFDYARGQQVSFGQTPIRHDGRVMAANTKGGVVLWDLARGTPLGFLRIGGTGHVLFEASGDLITSGVTGVWRWPVQLTTERGQFRIGPPTRLTLPASGLAEDRQGRILAGAYRDYAWVATPKGHIRVGPLDDCRSVAVSPDGKWLVTGSHGHTGFQVWRISDATQVANQRVEGLVEVLFSPDGKWLLTTQSPCQLWAVGTWRAADHVIGGTGLGFSPDGRLVVVLEASKVLRLVVADSGRTLARLESPDLCDLRFARFTPDGSRLVVTSPDEPLIHVWDLRAIRRQLALRGLDWDAPPFSAEDPADPASPPFPRLRVNHGPLGGHLQHYTESPEVLVQRYSAQLKESPREVMAYHHRAHALINLKRYDEAIDDFTRAIDLYPDEAHLRGERGKIHALLQHSSSAIADLEAAIADETVAERAELRESLATCYNRFAWQLANAPGSSGDLARAILLARRAVELEPNNPHHLNTLGVAEYRAGGYADALATLERSRSEMTGDYAAYDLLFMAMAHHRLGHRDEARDCRDRAARMMETRGKLLPEYMKDLAIFLAEADLLLSGIPDELPVDVFAPAS